MVIDGAPQLINLLADSVSDVRHAAVVAFGKLTQHGKCIIYGEREVMTQTSRMAQGHTQRWGSATYDINRGHRF
jgi:hypothetical protein